MKSIITILEQLESKILKTTSTKPIADAVKNRKKISFYYSGPNRGKDSVKAGNRIDAEGVAIGLTKRGNIAVRAYVEPPSVSKKGFGKTGWRTFLLSRMRNVKVSDETFDSKRPDYKEGTDGSFSVTYVTSDWGKTSKLLPKTEPTPQPTKPEVKPTKPEVKPTEPKLTEPKPKEKPAPPPQVEPKPTEPTPPIEKEPETKQELPQPKPQEKPSVNPEEKPEEEENDGMLKESLNRIKRLMFS
jgi:WYL domain